jgi:hypothetical protein
MKKQKMSLEKMKGVLNNVLSREEMKEIMAGSGGVPPCSWCYDEASTISWFCYDNGDGCRCQGWGYVCYY